MIVVKNPFNIDYSVIRQVKNLSLVNTITEIQLSHVKVAEIN